MKAAICVPWSAITSSRLVGCAAMASINFPASGLALAWMSLNPGESNPLPLPSRGLNAW